MKISTNSARVLQRLGVGLLFGGIIFASNHPFFRSAASVTAPASPLALRAVIARPTPLPQQPATEQLLRHSTQSLSMADLLAKAQTEGAVRVIVRLRTGFLPEGKLEDVAAVQEQRLSIAQTQDALLSQMTAFSVTGIKQFTFIPFLALEVDAAALRFLQTAPEVVSIQEDEMQTFSLAESVPLISAPAAWAAGFTGSGQTVAILDTGVDKTHPFLASKVVSEACYSTTSSSLGTTSTCPGGVTRSTEVGSGVNCNAPGCEHGTHVAGIAAGRSATTSGVARDANLIAIQVFSRVNNCPAGSGNCTTAFISDVVLGLQRVHELRTTYNIAAVNMSLGGAKFTANCDASQPAYKTAIDNLRSVGIATIVSSGNDSYTGSLASPACISTAISVGSTGDGSNGSTADAVSSFSNSASFLHLLAPGIWINSSIPGGGFANFSGTSMAAPHVAGAWAILKSKSPNASVEQILMSLNDTGMSITDPRNGISKPRIRVNNAAMSLSTTACNYSIAPTSQNFPVSGGTGTVNVVTTSGCAWTASSNVPWVTVTAGSNATGNGSVSFTVAANTAMERTGTILVAGQTFTVTQASVTALAVDDGTFESSTGLAAGGNSFRVNRLTPTSYPATINAVGIFFPSGNGVRVGDALTLVYATHPSGSTNINGITFNRMNVTVQALDQFNIFQIPSTTTTSGDFVVGMQITHVSGAFPFALDQTPPDRQRSYRSLDGTTFALIASVGTPGNYGIRAVLAPPPVCATVTGINPTNGLVGSTVTITGTNFTGVSAVRFTNNVSATFTVNSDTSITATVPSGAVTGPITISKTGCSEVQTPVFTVTAPPPSCPTVSGLSPTSGLVGSNVTITGTNFTGVSAVRFTNNVSATFTVNSDTSITAVVPSGAVTGPITISKPGCADVQTPVFTVNVPANPLPVLTSLNPNSAAAGSAGFTLAVTGTGFVHNSVVRWNGADRPTNFVSATQLTAAIAASDIAAPGNASVTVFTPAPGGGVSGALTFTILPAVTQQCNTVLCFADASEWCNRLSFVERYRNHKVVVPGVSFEQAIAVVIGGRVNPLVRQYLGCGGFERSDLRSRLIAEYLAAQLDIQTQLPFWWIKLSKEALGCHVITPMSMPGMPGAPRALPVTLSGGPVPSLTNASSLQDLYDATNWVMTRGSMDDLQKLLAIYSQLNTCRRD